MRTVATALVAGLSAISAQAEDTGTEAKNPGVTIAPALGEVRYVVCHDLLHLNEIIAGISQRDYVPFLTHTSTDEDGELPCFNVAESDFIAGNNATVRTVTSGEIAGHTLGFTAMLVAYRKKGKILAGFLLHQATTEVADVN